MSKMIQIRHVPDAIHKKLRAKALSSDMTLSDYLLREVAALAELWSPDEAFQVLSTRSPVALDVLAEDTAAVVRSERAKR